MSANELFRFRTIRPLESKQPRFSALSVSSTVQSPVKHCLSQLAINLATLLETVDWLEEVSDQLAAVSDEISPSAVIALLSSDWHGGSAFDNWLAAERRLLGARGTEAFIAPTYGAE